MSVHVYLIFLGVYSGYSAMSVALALPDDGKVVACDVSTEYPDIGRPYWKEAEVAHKIDLRIGPAIETLRKSRIHWRIYGGGEGGIRDAIPLSVHFFFHFYAVFSTNGTPTFVVGSPWEILNPPLKYAQHMKIGIHQIKFKQKEINSNQIKTK